MSQRKEVEEFYAAYRIWEEKGSPEMIPVVAGKGPFSSKLSMAANFRLFYLYDPRYVRYSEEIM